MKILAIDCSAVAASVAIVENDKVLSYSYTNVGLTHSQTLVPMINSTLKQASITLDDIDAYAINAGPGSFTGVRIGVAALKGLTALTEDNSITVSTLESMAYNYAGVKDCIVCAAMDARCKQTYTATFEVKDGRVKRLTDDSAIMIDELKTVLKDKSNVIFVGDGASLCYNMLREDLPEASVAPMNLLYQNAVSVARCDAAHIENGEKLIPSEKILPTYLRAPQAERELKRKQSR